MRNVVKCLATFTLVAGVVALPNASRADIAYEQNFDSGSATFTTSSPYWTAGYTQVNNQGDVISDFGTNGQIITSTTRGDGIPADASGSGFFLFENTFFSSFADKQAGNGSIVAAGSQFFVSPTFAVRPNTSYTVSFALANDDTLNVAEVMATIDGTNVNGGDSASGSGTWQTFSYTWNSGDNTTASLVLSDLISIQSGNDFGIDNIEVRDQSSTSVPEPATMAVLGVGLVGLARARRRRRGSAIPRVGNDAAEARRVVGAVTEFCL